jgi:hypothetical protein
MFSGRFHRERANLALRLDEEIRASLSDDKIPAVNDALVEVFGEFSIGTFPETREMRFFLGDVRAFSPGLIARLRRLVANEFPRWTVVPQLEECGFLVTATGVVFGDNWVRASVTSETPAFQEWRARAEQVDANKYGPLRHQLAWLRPRVREALGPLESERATLLGAFQGLQTESSVLWVLSAAVGGRTCLDWAAPHSKIAAYPVVGGAIAPEGVKGSSRAPEAWLTAFVTTASLPGPVSFQVADRDAAHFVKTFHATAPLDDRALS